MGDHVRVEIFDDRIEIESPGRFPGLVDPSDPFSVTRFARNPRIARVCADLRFGQELGEGIRRMFEKMRLAGLVDPLYRQTAGSVRLTLLSTPVDRHLEDRLPPGARLLVRHIREVGRASTGDLVDATKSSRPVVIRQLKALRAEGLVEWVGRSPKDPRPTGSCALNDMHGTKRLGTRVDQHVRGAVDETLNARSKSAVGGVPALPRRGAGGTVAGP